MNNTITECETGICLESSSQDNTAHFNNISSTTEYGADASNNDGYTIDATHNWWAHASGPYHSSSNPTGEGDKVSDDVMYSPWIDYPPFDEYTSPESTIDSVDPSFILHGEEIEFKGHGTSYDSIDRYVWSSDLDGELYNDTVAWDTRTLFLRTDGG